MTAVENDQVRSLWRAWKEDGDAEAERALVERYAGLVDRVIAQLARSLTTAVPVEDLRSYGMIGLLDAMRKFDYRRGLRFETYAVWRIRGAIYDGLREMDWVPRSFREKAKKVEDAYAELEQRYLRSVTEEEVSHHLGMPVESLHQVLRDMVRAVQVSLDEPVVDDEGSSTSRHMTVTDHEAPSPEDLVQAKQVKEILARAIERLPEKERLVVTLFYYESLSLTEIAEVMGLSPSRISQLHTKAIYRLRGALGRYKRVLCAP
ncbi:MAG: FliA/WhiG family RNA polymerase sigma factor [Bacillota bacterium]